MTDRATTVPKNFLETSLMHEDFEIGCENCDHIFQPPVNAPRTGGGSYWSEHETRCPKCEEITNFDKVGEPPGP